MPRLTIVSRRVLGSSKTSPDLVVTHKLWEWPATALGQSGRQLSGHVMLVLSIAQLLSISRRFLFRGPLSVAVRACGGYFLTLDDMAWFGMRVRGKGAPVEHPTYLRFTQILWVCRPQSWWREYDRCTMRRGLRRCFGRSRGQCVKAQGRE